MALVDVSVFQAALEQPLHGLVMALLGSADEMIVLETEGVPLLAEFGGDGG